MLTTTTARFDLDDGIRDLFEKMLFDYLSDLGETDPACEVEVLRATEDEDVVLLIETTARAGLVIGEAPIDRVRAEHDEKFARILRREVWRTSWQSAAVASPMVATKRQDQRIGA